MVNTSSANKHQPSDTGGFIPARIYFSLKVMQEQQKHAIWGRPVHIPTVQERRNTLITHLNAEIRSLDKELKELLLNDPDWGHSARLLLSIPGIGLVAAAWIQVATLNFTTCDTPEQAASFAGLVPRQRQSGNMDSPRHIGHAGHARLRQVLYLSTVTALRFNPIIKRYYERLIARGKPGKVAVIACERKLLHIAWTCVVKERMFIASC